MTTPRPRPSASSLGPELRSALVAMVRRRVPASDVEDIVQATLAEAHETLDWLLREGEGEKLEAIAASEKLPAPRVRQRVSRLRRHLKANWRREVALLAAVGVIVTSVLLALRRAGNAPPIAHEPNVVPLESGAEPIRREALERCARADFRACVEGLDEAKRLDPAGDARTDVERARAAAARALAAPPTSAAPPPDRAAPTKASPPAPRPVTKPTSTFAPARPDAERAPTKQAPMKQRR